MSSRRYLSAREAAEELGVSLRTLYAYVSRGMIRSEAAGGRRRRYRAEDVRRLKERKERRRRPEDAVEGALSWGTPVMESGITLITDEGFYYRGRDVVELSRRCGIEEVAALVWVGDESAAGEIFGFGAPPSVSSIRETVGGLELPPLEALQAALPLAAAGDPVAYDLRPDSAARTGGRILRLMAAVASGGEGTGGVAGTLCRGWGLQGEGTRRVLDAALVLCADHELPVSTFAARCAASSGASPYAAVSAGLAAFGGSRHGGALYLVESFLGEIEARGDVRGVIGAWFRRGEGVPGFGHPLYPDGDPRGAELLHRVSGECPGSPAVRLARTVVREVREMVGENPTVDFALVTLARALGLPPGAAVALFAVGRAVGWIGHAIEQYASGSLIRPRARYVGEPPA
nr:citrate synthase family protein [Rubrobacter xylanophilus]